MQAFIRENASMFRVFAFRYLQDAEVVDDVLQESYMKLWINRSKSGSVKSPRNYFFSIIKNTIADKRLFLQGQRRSSCRCFGWWDFVA
ncbi:MAG: RNA polymerase sigma factor [Butyricimonas paravirosa]